MNQKQPHRTVAAASGNMISVEKLEEILVAQWSAFINPAKLLVWTMKEVRARLDTSFIVVNDADFSNRGTQITVSRCQLKSGCFLLWIDFTIPYDSKIAVGTVEARLGFDGSLTADAASGNLYGS
jgi:hypothetical protein